MYLKIKFLFKFLLNYLKFLCLFLLPNLGAVIRKRLIYLEIPILQQNTIFSGRGIVRIGRKCTFGYKLGGFHKGGSIEIQARYKKSIINIGNNIATNNNVFVCAANYIEIGEDSLIGQNVTIMDHEAHNIDPLKRREIGEIGQIIIGKNVWIGNNVVILKNTEIGENSIVGTGAVVSGKFPPNVIIGGVPAKIIRNI